MTEVTGFFQIESLVNAIQQDGAWRWMVAFYHPRGPGCPNCRQPISGPRALDSFWSLGRVYCKACDSTFTATSGTPIHETSWSPEQFVKFCFLIATGRSAAQIALILGKGTDTVRNMRERVEIWNADINIEQPPEQQG